MEHRQDSERSSERHSPEPVTDGLEFYNHTELYQLARALNLPVYPHTATGDVRSLLREEAVSAEYKSHPIDEYRHGIMQMLLEYWDGVSAQLSCPAKSGDPRACFGCIDSQVLSCVVENRDHLVTIRNLRKQEVPPKVKTMADAKLTIDNAPRDPQELLGSANRYMFRQLASELGILEDNPTLNATFKTAPLNVIAVTVSDALKEYDSKNGGKKTAAKKVQEPVDEDESDAEAEEEEEKLPARTPVHSTTKLGRGSATAEKHTETSAAGGGATEKQIAELQSSVTTLTKVVLEHKNEMAQTMARLEDKLMLLMGITAPVGMHIMGADAGLEDVIAQAKDMTDVLQEALNPPPAKPVGKGVKKG